MQNLQEIKLIKNVYLNYKGLNRNIFVIKLIKNDF